MFARGAADGDHRLLALNSRDSRYSVLVVVVVAVEAFEGLDVDLKSS